MALGIDPLDRQADYLGETQAKQMASSGAVDNDSTDAVASSSASTLSSIELLANSAIAAGCLQAVMSLVHPELTKYVDFQRERVNVAERRQSAAGNSKNSARANRMVDISSTSPSSEAVVDDDPDRQTDLSMQLKFLRDHWHSHLRFYGGDPQLPVVVKRALMYRNKVSHQSQLTLDQYEDAIETFETLAELIECNALIRRQIRDLVTKLLSFSSSATAPPATLKPCAPVIMPLNAGASDKDDESMREMTWEDLKIKGNECFKAGEMDKAIERYSKAIELAPREAVLYGNRATCRLRQKEFELAREDAEEALDEDCDNVKYYRLLSEALIGLHEYEEAKEVCGEGLALNPEDKVLITRSKNLEAKIANLVKERKKIRKLEEDEKEKEKKASQRETTSPMISFRKKKESIRQQKLKQEVQDKKSNKKKKQKDKQQEWSQFHIHHGAKPSIPANLVPMINYEKDIPANEVEVFSPGSKKLIIYGKGMEFMSAAAKVFMKSNAGSQDPWKPHDSKTVQLAVEHFRQAADAGVAEAWYRLAMLYGTASEDEPIDGIKFDPKKQAEYFYRAANCKPFLKHPGSSRIILHRGVAESENELGICFRHGNSVFTIDLKKAFTFFLKSAQHDYPPGQYHVANAYMNGEGTATNLEAARFWTARAAQHGLPEAQANLADMLRRGIGGVQDVNAAGQWFQIANHNSVTAMMSRLSMDGIQSLKPGGEDDFDAYWNMYDDFEDDLYDYDSDVEEGIPSCIKLSSYTPTRTNVCRPPSSVIKAQVVARRKAGGLVAAQFCLSERKVNNAWSLLQNENQVAEAIRELMAADMLWDRCYLFWPPSLLGTALPLARKLYESNRKHLEAAYFVGRWDMLSDQDRVQHWKQCVKAHPSVAIFHFYLGVSYANVRNYDAAITAYEKALELEHHTFWLYYLASSMISLGMADAAMVAYQEYIAKTPPDACYVPDVYYALGVLHLKKQDVNAAIIHNELGKMAESTTIRFPALYPFVEDEAPKEALHEVMKVHGLLNPTRTAETMAPTMLACDFCDSSVKAAQLLMHKLSKCPRRPVMCQVCDAQMVFDSLYSHQQREHPELRSELTSANLHTLKKQNYLTAPKLHFMGEIKQIIAPKGSTKSTVFMSKVLAGESWTIRVDQNLMSYVSEAAIGSTLLIFWRDSPSLESIDNRSLHLTSKAGDGEVYGVKLTLHVVKCSLQQIMYEVTQLRHLKHIETEALCSNCCSPTKGGLASCSACKRVQYCSRDCQRIHWKRIHRHLCKNTLMQDQLLSLSEDITPPNQTSDVFARLAPEEVNYFPASAANPGNTLEIIEALVRSLGHGATLKESKTEHLTLPPTSGQPHEISASIRVYRKAGSKESWAQYRVGYLQNTPTPAQQCQLRFFFQLPPHNPLRLNFNSAKVYLLKCESFVDDSLGKGFRMGSDVSLSRLPAPALAELLDYLLVNSNIYLN